MRATASPRTAWAGAAVVLSLTATGCAEPPGLEPTTLTGSTMGTTWTVRFVPAVEEPEAGRIRDLVEAELEAVDAAMSTWRSDSELSTFNSARSTEALSVSEPLLRILEESVRVGRVTAGAFDVTVGPLVNAFGFGAEHSGAPPSAAVVEELRARTGLHLLEIDPDARTIRKLHPLLYVDLSGIAKGHAVDRVAAALTQAGLARFMVEVGGEVKTRGANAEGLAWRIGVERPDAVRGAVERVLPLRDMALATSGDYRNFRIVDDRRLTHIFDPRSGESVHHALASATVLDESCATADALATAMVVLGPDEALALAERDDQPLLLLVRDGDGFLERRSRALDRLLSAVE